MIIPTGNSIGAMMTRPNVSADNSNNEPKIAVSGNSFACLAPTNLLAICGAIKPKNEMPPPTETHTPANATEIINKSLRSFSTCTPTPMAIESPKRKTSNTFDL